MDAEKEDQYNKNLLECVDIENLEHCSQVLDLLCLHSQ